MTAAARAEFPSTLVTPDPLETAIERARSALLSLEKGDGHWCFELEADAPFRPNMC